MAHGDRGARLGALNAGGDAAVLSVSCALAGNCAVGGFYTDGSGHRQALVVSERDGTWRTAIEMPGSGTLNRGRGCHRLLGVVPLGGQLRRRRSYADRSGLPAHFQAFVVSQA